MNNELIVLDSNSTYDHDYLFKIVIVGDSNVGKTAVISRFADDTYTDNTIGTIGVDFKIKTVDINGKIIKLQIWDTAGQEKFRTICSSYCRHACGIIITYDICKRESFDNIENWLNEINKYSTDSIKLLIGTKYDLSKYGKREVSTEEGQQMANKLNIPFIEVSAKENININKLFCVIINEIKNKSNIIKPLLKKSLCSVPATDVDVEKIKKCC